MNPSAVLRSERLRPLTRLAAAWGVWVTLGLAAASPLRASEDPGALTPAGTVITHEATVTYQTENGEEFFTASAVSVVVAQVAGVDIDPPRISISGPGSAVVFSHLLRNVGNGPDSIDVAAVSAFGAAIRVFHDVDADGLLTFADTLVSGPITLDMGATARVLVEVTVSGAMSPGDTDMVSVTATSRFDSSVVDAVSNEIRFTQGGVDPQIGQLVDLAQASPGDLLTYSVRIRVDGAEQTDSIVFENKIPTFATYEAGTIQLDGQNLTDASDADAGWYQPATGVLRVDLGSLGTGEEAVVLFQVRIDGSASIGSQVTNIARLAAHTPAGTINEAAPPVVTVVAAPDLAITKSVAGLNPAVSGDTLVYTIEVANPSSALSAVDLTVVDTLPEPLLLVRADPVASVSGRELRWTVARLDPGETIRFQIFAQVPDVTAPVSVVNRAHLQQSGGGAASADSEPRSLMPSLDASLALDLVAEVVEIQIGEVLPLRATLTNDGQSTVAEVLVKLVLPKGTRFIDSELIGAFTGLRPSPAYVEGPDGPAPVAPPGEAGPPSEPELLESPMPLDSFQVVGDTLFVRIAGELRPQESAQIRYLLLVNSAPEGVLLNKAIAEARRGTITAVSTLLVASNQAQALVGLGRNRALETRSVIGKVFHDLDGDGFQDPDEPGVAGIDVMTADGELVTTDAFGKLSFNDLRPGRHAFRVDPLSVPAGLSVPTVGPGRRLQVVEVNGWNTARLSFALVGRPADGSSVGAAVDRASEEPESGSQADAESDSESVHAGPLGAEPDVRLAPLRTEAERDSDEKSAFLHGPAIRINAPADGFVSPTNRVYIGAQGEPMAGVALFRGDSVLVEGQLLPNGVGDFVGVELQPGRQVFRLRMANSWGNVRWDSIVVHQTGPPVRFEPEDERVVLTADGRTAETTRVRLLDAWGVPVVNEPFVTVRMDGGSFVGRDVDPSSVGHQLQADRMGWVTVEMVGARDSGRGTLLLEVPDAEAAIPVTVLPAVRPLFLTGVGQLSLGSAGDGFGAVTAQGRLTDETALTLSFDSRRLDQGRDVFGRNFDPLDAGRQPIMGDASEQRSLSSSRYRFSARIEKGLDWLMFGDVLTSGFSDGMDLARYGRALPGAAARVTTGAVVWNAFGASTTQALRQQQIRGSGTSGPFELGSGILPGTEEVRVQVRALENATRVLSEQLLTRFAEYQIDYARGTLLLKQPVPAADAFGNPIFLLVTYEGESGGDHSPVWGVRASSDVGGFVGELVDSVPVSVSVVNDGQPGSGFMLGAIRTGVVQESGLEVTAEVAVAEGADSTGVATRIKGASPLFDGRVDVSAEWTHVGDEFSNPGNIALRSGTEELRTSAGAKVGAGQLTVAHDRQLFTARDLERRRTTIGYAQTVAEDVKVDARIAGDASSTAGEEVSSGAGEYRVTWTAMPRLDVFAEGRNELWSNGEGLANRGAYYGGGASYRLAKSFGVEARHLRVTPTGDASPYALTSIGLTSDLRVGTKAWGSYQISGGVDGQTNAAVVGLNHRFSIGPDWRFSTMLERRNGVSGAAFGDPVLSSPFDRPEENYTSASFGTEYLPQSKPYRASFRAENREGNLSTSRLATLAGDVSINAGLALLSRQEFVERDVFGSQTTRYTRERSSLWGLAYRPTQRDDLNILFKFNWKDATNPFGTGVLAADGEESRLIGAMEAIWAPRSDLELGARFATRTTRLGAQSLAGDPVETRSQTEFVGVRGRWDANQWLGVELEARGAMTSLVAGSFWDVAPSLVGRPVEAIEIELGYRFGDLQDPDFAVRSGSGTYLTIGTRVTEDLVGSAAAFWRSRFGG